jgi:hypothetical protein
MLDLSKPLDAVEGLVLFGDHQEPDLVYYLPDEIDLSLLTADTPDLSLQIFYPDEAVTSGDLGNAVGSILSLGVHCVLSPERAGRVRSALASRLNRDGIRLVPAPWEDGTVDLLLLDSQSGDSPTSATANDPLVRGVAGSRHPSLSDGNLSALFHARLDRRGTALAAAALHGQAGSLAGALYDLKFAALRPAIDMRMSADLNRCAQFIKAGAGVQVYYVAADISTSFGKMREKGIIDVEVTSQMSDPESEKLVDQAVHDFYDVLMRELFKPTISPAEALGAAGVPGVSAQTSIVRFSFSYAEVEQERKIEVDYRKRSATRRTHNPQAHLARLAALGGGADALIQRVPLSAAWREFSVRAAVPGAFDDRKLQEVRCVIWRGKDAVLAASEARDGGLRMPESAAPLADFAWTADRAGPRQLAWVAEPQEPPFYRWQARLTYADDDTMDSPAEIWSEPWTSSSGDLDLFPQNLAPLHRVTLSVGGGHDDSLTGVEVAVAARDAAKSLLASRRLAVGRDGKTATWAVRRSEGQRVLLEGALTYHYAGGRALALPPVALLDPELIANDPFATVRTLSPLVVGAPDDLLEVGFLVHYQDAATGYRQDAVARLRPPDFRADDVRIAVLHAADRLRWEAVTVLASGATRAIGNGESEGGVVVLQPVGAVRRIRVEWIGQAPADLGLTWAKVTLRARGGDGQVIATKTLQLSGAAEPPEQTVVLPAEGVAEWSIESRFQDGHHETTPFQPIAGDVLAVPA